MAHLGPDHFLSLTRPDIHVGPSEGVVDTTTLAAHDFDVDTRTGFMPPQTPLRRLTSEWESWEVILDSAIFQKLQLGDSPNILQSAKDDSERWRERVQNVRMPCYTAKNDQRSKPFDILLAPSDFN